MLIEPKVLHVKNNGKQTNNTQVYIGRPSKWGNPFIIGKDGTHLEVIEKYKQWLLTQDLDISELRGRHLICFCSPLPCHGDILLELANK